MTKFRWIVSFFVAATIVPMLLAETHCPGNVASITPRYVQGVLIVIPVMINREGPFDFMVDTGSEVTVIDPALASQLQLKSRGTAALISVADVAQGAITLLETLEGGSHVIEKPFAIVRDLGLIHAADARIRGVLGENFLSRFDVLIDYGHKLLCLDQTAAMRERVHGERIPMVMSQRAEDDLPFVERLVIATRLSGAGTRQILLQLDSGSDGPILFAHTKENALPLLDRATAREGNLTEAQKAFATLPPQKLLIGERAMSNIPFVTPVRVARNVPPHEEDGLLPTVLFQRIFISGEGHYVVFDPKFQSGGSRP